MIELKASPAELAAAIDDAITNDDERAVSALVVELGRVDRAAAVALVRGDRFSTWWFYGYRQRWLA